MESFVKRRLFLVLLTISLFVNPALFAAPQQTQLKPAPQTSSVASAEQLQTKFINRQLSNGLEIIVLEDHSIPLVTCELAVRNGSFTEPPELNGLSHLYEHMFFKSNHATLLYLCEHSQITNPSAFRKLNCSSELELKPQLKDVEYIGYKEALGMAENGRTQEEVVEYYFNTTSPHLAPALKSIRDAARFPLFDENEFTSEKEVVIGELDRHMSEPFYYLNQAM